MFVPSDGSHSECYISTTVGRIDAAFDMDYMLISGRICPTLADQIPENLMIFPISKTNLVNADADVHCWLESCTIPIMYVMCGTFHGLLALICLKQEYEHTIVMKLMDSKYKEGCELNCIALVKAGSYTALLT